MKLGWLSDIHLNFLAADAIAAFVTDLARHEVDAWLISGDIASSG